MLRRDIYERYYYLLFVFYVDKFYKYMMFFIYWYEFGDKNKKKILYNCFEKL